MKMALKRCAHDGYSVDITLKAGLCLRHFFFFSSRRRHTRFDCDWSSDVCSSDLIASTSSRRSRPRSFDAGIASTRCRSRTPVATPARAPSSPGATGWGPCGRSPARSEEHTSELQSQSNLVCRLLLEKKKTRHCAHAAPAALLRQRCLSAYQSSSTCLSPLQHSKPAVEQIPSAAPLSIAALVVAVHVA